MTDREFLAQLGPRSSAEINCRTCKCVTTGTGPEAVQRHPEGHDFEIVYFAT